LRIEPGMLRDLRVTTRPVESRPAGETVISLGELRVNEEAYAEVGSSIPARIERVLVGPGDAVAAGQTLVELTSAEVGRARAALGASRVRAELAEKTVQRRRVLAADQIVPARELQASEAEWAQAEAERRAAEAALSALGAASGSGPRFVLRAPISGTVIDRTALRGQMIGPEQTLFSIGDLSRLWLVAHVFERDALRMQTGTSARVTFPALPAEPFVGQVTRIGSRVDPASRTLDVRIEVDNPSGVLRPGMSGSALVPLADSGGKVLAVPVESLQRLPQGWSAFLPRAEAGVFEIRTVGRGRDLGSEVEVLSGLREGEQVVVDGAFLLKAEAHKARGGEAEHQH
jgi:cobalt-zinc-cadmium efflux system membrane fusion protein